MPVKYSGHESFACRYAWLPKSLQAIQANPRAFADEDQAMVNLGKATQEFYGEYDDELLKPEEREYLESLATKRGKTSEPVEDDTEFYRNHRGELKNDAVLKSTRCGPDKRAIANMTSSCPRMRRADRARCAFTSFETSAPGCPSRALNGPRKNAI